MALRDASAARRHAHIDDLIRSAVESAVLAPGEPGALGPGRSRAADTARLHALLDGVVLGPPGRRPAPHPDRARDLPARYLPARRLAEPAA